MKVNAPGSRCCTVQYRTRNPMTLSARLFALHCSQREYKGKVSIHKVFLFWIFISELATEYFMDFRVTPSLLALPPELREEIYKYSIKWPNLSQSFNDLQRGFLERERCEGGKRTLLSTSHLKMETPAMLLVNRQITAEGLVFLRKQPFLLTSPCSNGYHISDFLSRSTLQSLRVVSLTMDLEFCKSDAPRDANGWLTTIETLIDIWRERNSLEKLEVRSKYHEPSRALGWTFLQAGHHQAVVLLLSKVRRLFDFELIALVC
jgi:hypothetical protein